jgi:hypothetical protein
MFNFFTKFLSATSFLLGITIIITSPTQAIFYHDTTDNDWCTSVLQDILNDTVNGYPQTFTSAELAILKAQDCGDKFSIITKQEWELYKNNYQTGLNNGDTSYLPNGILEAWTHTATDSSDPQAEIFYIIPNGDATQHAPANTSTPSALPTIIFNDTLDLCVIDDATSAGTLTNPYVFATECPINIFSIDLTPPEPGWPPEPQEIYVIVNNEDPGSCITRVAYSWNIDDLGDDCSGGTTIYQQSSECLQNWTSPDIGYTHPGGETTLYACVSNNDDEVRFDQDVYRLRPNIIAPILEHQVGSDDLFWNLISLSPNQNTFILRGYFEPTNFTETFALSLNLNGHNYTPSSVITTSTIANRFFEFHIPVSDFAATKNNYIFTGPFTLSIIDQTPNSTRSLTLDWNVSFYFPIYQPEQRANHSGAFILATDSRLN